MSEQAFDEQKSFIELVQRSKDIGEGWRQVAPFLWNYVKNQVAKATSGVFELDEVNHRIRFTQYS